MAWTKVFAGYYRSCTGSFHEKHLIKGVEISQNIKSSHCFNWIPALIFFKIDPAPFFVCLILLFLSAIFFNIVGSDDDQSLKKQQVSILSSISFFFWKILFFTIRLSGTYWFDHPFSFYIFVWFPSFQSTGLQSLWMLSGPQRRVGFSPWFVPTLLFFS